MSRSCLIAPRWRRNVFSTDRRNYQRLDALLAAMLRGEWPAFERPLVERLACLAEAGRLDSWPASSRVEEAATAFRYDRDLLTTEETEAWIERAGLTLDDWTDFISGRLLRDEWSPRLDDLVQRAGAIRITENAFAAEGACSQAFDRMATVLAGRVAVCAAHPDLDLDRTGIEGRIAQVRSDHRAWLEGMDPADVDERFAHLGWIHAACAAHLERAATPEALSSQLARHRLEWMRIDLERLAFDREDAAREAVWCVREDGLTLSEVAIVSRQSVRDTRTVLDRLEAELRDAVLSASPDQLIGPIAVGSRYEVVCVVGKAEAALTDPLVRQRAEEALTGRLVAEATRAHVRWAESSGL